MKGKYVLLAGFQFSIEVITPSPTHLAASPLRDHSTTLRTCPL